MGIKNNGVPYEFTEKELEAIIQLVAWAREREDSSETVKIVATALNRNAFNAMGKDFDKYNKTT